MFKIGNKAIKKNGEPFIIAEAGINHNGELEKAFAMIEVAKKCGADAVKFQTFKAEEFIADPKQKYTYKSQGKKITESMLKMFKRYEFSCGEWFAIKKKCDKEKIVFMSTPQNYSDLELLLKIGIPAIKVGSDDFTNTSLLKSYAKTKLPIILSCGMADFKEICSSLTAIGALSGYPTVLLLCTSQYPTPPQDVNILKMVTLRKEFPDLVLGYSDHTEGQVAAILAVSMGAVVFEKHFTLDHSLPGPDHWFSEDPDGLKKWITAINTSYSMLGKFELKPTIAEQKMRKIARRTIVVLNDLIKGDVLSSENIGLRRTEEGMSARQYETILGKKAKHSIHKGMTLHKEDIE